MAEIELHPGMPFCDIATLNRINRQQGLCLAIAQASVYDEICQVVPLSEAEEEELTHAYLHNNDVDPADTDAIDRLLSEQGLSRDDLRYIATKRERMERFKKQVFSAEVERRFLSEKLSHDQVTYSLIRVRDGDWAFELHQRIVEGDASFEELASQYSEGPERDSAGRLGPVPFDQAHPSVVEKLRSCEAGELLEPFFLVNIWLILRLDQWDGARLDDAMREELIEDLFEQWLDDRVSELLAGRTPGLLPTHLLEGV